MTNRILPIALIIAASLSACKAPGRQELLQQYKWKVSTAVTKQPIAMNPGSKTSTDLIAQSPECVKDDLFIFHDKGVFEQNDNVITCQDQPAQKGKWELRGNDSLMVDFGEQDMRYVYKIIKLDKKELVMMTNMNFIPGGIDVTYTFTSQK